MTGTSLSPLTTAEESDLARLEETIEKGLARFVVVGKALLRIRDERLYRATHSSFEAYVSERWQMSKTHANRLVQSTEVMSALTPMGVIPASERQARELAPLLDEPEQLRDAWQEASENGKPTAASVREAVEQRKPPAIVVPLNEDLLERQQRETLIQVLDRAVYALEGPPSNAEAEARRLLAEGDAGPFAPSRFERVIAYAAAFAEALRKAGIDG